MDHDELIAFTETLLADISGMESALREAGQTVPPRPQVRSNDFRSNDLIERTETLEAHRAKLKTMCNVAGLKVQLTTAKPLKENRMTTTTQPAPDRKPTATELALAAKGVSLEQWQASQKPKPPKVEHTGATKKLLEKFDAGTLEELAEKRKAVHRGCPND